VTMFVLNLLPDVLCQNHQVTQRTSLFDIPVSNTFRPTRQSTCQWLHCCYSHATGKGKHDGRHFNDNEYLTSCRQDCSVNATCFVQLIGYVLSASACPVHVAACNHSARSLLYLRLEYLFKCRNESNTLLITVR
jgi:hypothetical protein